jgi:two-component system sensor histidine kinase DegS
MIAVPLASTGAPHALIQRQIEEREQMSNELGEDVAQSLAALAMTLDDLDSSNPQDVRGRIAGARTLALQVMDDIRGLVTRLHPPTLRHFGLDAALKSFAERRFADSNVDVHVATVGTRPRRDQLAESVLFRAAQELMDDIYMRSDASAVLIIIDMSQKHLNLTIEDDGPGHDAAVGPSDTTQYSGISIAFVRQLVSSLGGTVALQYEHRRGTRVLITLPLGRDTSA